jgi:hypothetical protein
MSLRAAVVLAAALAAVGCESYPDESSAGRGGGVDEKLTKLEIDLANHKQGQVYTYEQLVNANKGLVERSTKLEMLVTALQTSVAHLEEQVKSLAARLAVDRPNPPVGEAPALAPASKKLEDILREVEETLSQLQSAKIARDEAATLLRPYGRHVAPRLLDEIAKSVTRFDYVKQLEYVLSRLAVPDLSLPLREALTRPGVRDSAVRVVGLTKSAELSRILEEHAAVPDDDFALLIGEALVQCRNAAGLPPLLKALKSEQGANRTIAIAALKKTNGNEDFGYRPQLPPASNAPAIKSWEDWAATFGKSIFE